MLKTPEVSEYRIIYTDHRRPRTRLSTNECWTRASDFKPDGRSRCSAARIPNLGKPLVQLGMPPGLRGDKGLGSAWRSWPLSPYASSETARGSTKATFISYQYALNNPSVWTDPTGLVPALRDRRLFLCRVADLGTNGSGIQILAIHAEEAGDRKRRFQDRASQAAPGTQMGIGT
jgi:hypothetical protein